MLHTGGARALQSQSTRGRGERAVARGRSPKPAGKKRAVRVGTPCPLAYRRLHYIVLSARVPHLAYATAVAPSVDGLQHSSERMVSDAEVAADVSLTVIPTYREFFIRGCTPGDLLDHLRSAGIGVNTEIPRRRRQRRRRSASAKLAEMLQRSHEEDLAGSDLAVGARSQARQRCRRSRGECSARAGRSSSRWTRRTFR